MIEVFKRENIILGGYYIIAPENPTAGTVNINDFTEVWQYGSDEVNDPVHRQDGVAPQAPVGNIGIRRAYIPSNVPQGFVTSHSIGNYRWIFGLEMGREGYVTPRK